MYKIITFAKIPLAAERLVQAFIDSNIVLGD